MTVKTEYNEGDQVWIHGISLTNNKLTEGKIVKIIDLYDEGFQDTDYYVIAIPNPIEPILEIRTWHTMSQDKIGPVGLLRGKEKDEIDSVTKLAAQVGLIGQQDKPKRKRNRYR
jgi:hypothetical protein